MLFDNILKTLLIFMQYLLNKHFAAAPIFMTLPKLIPSNIIEDSTPATVA
jgi:hypothetical protein